MKLYLWTDGGARGNPGPSAIGGVAKSYRGSDKMQTVFTFSECIGEGTNNRAEYMALIKGMRMAANRGAVEIVCYLDSELVVKQVTGAYRTKDPDLRKFLREVHGLSVYAICSFQHVPRHMNAEADKLVNKALDMLRKGVDETAIDINLKRE